MPEFLRSLAARARGNPGVAAALWRLALCGAQFGAGDGGKRRCVLPAWKRVAQPEMPPHSRKQGALLLHALLLHGGLHERLLPTVLPMAPATVSALLGSLHGRGIVAEAEGEWRVSAAGYPAARAHVAALNLPLDGF